MIKLPSNKMLLLFATAVLFIALGMIFIALRMNKSRIQVKKAEKSTKGREILNGFLQNSYLIFTNKPLIGAYIYKIRTRLETIHQYDEFKMRKETMLICYKVSVTLLFLFVLINIICKTLYFAVISLFVIMVLHDTLLDYFIDRLSNLVLRQQIKLFNDVRHNFHEHGMIEEAIFDACDHVPYEISLQAERVYKVLIDDDVEDALQNYYDVAPNRFLKAFAGISYLAREFGDKKVNGVSLFLKNLNYLVNETNMEILKREKFKLYAQVFNLYCSISNIGIKPIENWARRNFPSTNQFYDSGHGFMLQVLISLQCF